MDESLCNSDKYAVFVCFEGSVFGENKINTSFGSTYSMHGLKLSTW
jgi:hypothetical protein